MGQNALGILAASLTIAVGTICGCGIVGPNSSNPPEATPSPDDAANVEVAREIEEADIIKFDGNHLYLSNPYTGLRIIDVSKIDQPQLAGAYPTTGRGIEMFVRDDHAFVLTAADFGYCAGEPVGFDSEAGANIAQPEYSGSRLWVIDVSDKSAPVLTGTVTFEGSSVGTRRVGDIIYVAGNMGGGAVVLSIDISDPAAVHVVKNLGISEQVTDIHVESNVIFAAGPDATMPDTTLVTYVDISDPAGEVAQRDQFRVPGRIGGRFFMDAFENTFRIVTEEFKTETFTTVVALYTYDVSDPDDVKRLAELPLVTDESLRAVRFDGTRGYAVTFFAVDPLFVLDLANPSDPKIAGELIVPGFSTHLVPLGDRLIGVGFDGVRQLQPALALYDVTDPANPTQLSRIVLSGADNAWVASEATVDEKALRVIPDAGLVLLPYSVFDDDLGEFRDALQLIEYRDDRLLERGAIDHRGLVRRANLLDSRVWMLSDLAFQVIDIDDLDAPASVANLELISEQELLDSGLASCADSARFHGTSLGFFPFLGEGFFFCGAFSPVMMTLTLAGLVSFRRRRRAIRRRS